MVDSVKRKLRDGVADGEQAPVILVRDTVSTQGGISLLKDILLGSICDYVAKGLAQAKVVVVVAISESPESYAKIPSAADQDESNRVRNWLRIVDCYTDRLGWEGNGDGQSSNDAPVGGQNIFSLCRDIRNLDGLLSLILEAGRRGTAPLQTQDKFVVFFDSISLLLRYHSLHALASFLSTLRSYNETSALAYLLHSDLHTPQITSALEYLSSTTIAVGPHLELPSILDPNAKTTQLESFDKGLLKIRQKRRNGRVREQTEMFSCGADGFTFAPVESDPIDSRSGKFTVPKVQFNLSLTERELEDRSKVILPFEHQGDGRERRIYDGRENSKTVNFVSRSRDSTLVLGPDSGANPDTGFGAIHYLRDSDDERPDSDEDPDDDLDI